MNPSSSEHSGLSLPAPVAEQTPAATAPETAPVAAESAHPGGEKGGEKGRQVAQSMPAVAPAVIPSAIVPTVPMSSQSAASSTTQSAVQKTADDADLIEKEWVNKAKQIIERTAQDPYRQNADLTVVKADYMKQRYSKTLKVSE